MENAAAVFCCSVLYYLFRSQIVLDVGERVDLKPPEENMQVINLFESEQEIRKYLPLGLNQDYDQKMKFSPRDLVLVGGRRGAGKTFTCVNIANNVYEQCLSLPIYPSLKKNEVNYIIKHFRTVQGSSTFDFLMDSLSNY